MIRLSITDPAIFDSLVSLTTGILATSVAIATLLITLKMYRVAVRALNTWKEQKDHDLIIKALARSRKAKWYISYLRNPVSMDTEMDKELKAELDKLHEDLKRAFYPHYVIATRRKVNDKFLEEISEVYELCCAQLKESHVLTRYYKGIRDADNEIARAGHNLAVTEKMIATSELQRNDYRDRITEYMGTIYEVSGDKLSTEIDNLFKELEQFRIDYN